MKIKAVESLLKQTRCITLYDDDSCQWVSNGHACYPLRNMPMLDQDSIFTMLDVPEDKKDKYIFRRDELSVTTLDFSDNVLGERVFDRDLINLSMGGKEIEPLRSHSGGIVFLDTNPLIWEIYGEIYAARMLGHLAKEQYDKLWHRLYPYITGVRLVPEGERSVST